MLNSNSFTRSFDFSLFLRIPKRVRNDVFLFANKHFLRLSAHFRFTRVPGEPLSAQFRLKNKKGTAECFYTSLCLLVSFTKIGVFLQYSQAHRIYFPLFFCHRNLHATAFFASSMISRIILKNLSFISEVPMLTRFISTGEPIKTFCSASFS